MIISYLGFWNNLNLFIPLHAQLPIWCSFLNVYQSYYDTLEWTFGYVNYNLNSNPVKE